MYEISTSIILKETETLMSSYLLQVFIIRLVLYCIYYQIIQGLQGLTMNKWHWWWTFDNWSQQIA